MAKIAIIGSHSTGKTTICNEFIKLHSDYFLIPEIARIFGIEKIEKTLEVQYEMMNTQKLIESHHNNFISDRSILDFGIYAMNEPLINKCLSDMKGRYDYLFYIPIRFKIFDDGFRNTDYLFQHQIDDLFIKWMPKETIRLNSITIEDRIKEIHKHIFSF